MLAGSIVLAGVQALFKYQGVFSNFPMRLRWNFHRLMLEQSMTFYQDEFAGRIATKVMQTALAVRDTWLIVADILVYVVIYFVTMVAVVGAFDAWLMVPFLGWLVLYIATLWYFVPRLGKVAQAQADARSLMTGRVTDAYTNIGTVKLFSHSHREAHFARSAMQEFMVTAYGQMRLVTAFEIVNQIAERAAHRRHRRRQPELVDAERGRRRRGGGGHRDGFPAERHLALGDVGDGLAVRAHRHRAGRHGDAVARALGGRPARRPGRWW